jgi:DNA helicase HerA-like ATPase
VDVVTRRELEAAVEPLAWSVDGRRFAFQVPVTATGFHVGGYVAIGDGGSSRPGQVLELERAVVRAADVLGADAGGADLRIAVVRGEGTLLGPATDPFHDAAVARADRSQVLTWLDAARPTRAALDVGALVVEPEVRFALDAGGFNRHTFLCGQSGSGKTYSLGVILEQLLLETSLRIVILDPNSDFTRIAELRDDASTGESAARYAGAADEVVVRSAGGEGDERLHVRFVDLDAVEQAAVLRLDPIADAAEYEALLEAVRDRAAATVPPSSEDVGAALLGSADPVRQALGRRMRNLMIDEWQVWSQGAQGSLQDLAAPGGPRCLVVDLGSLPTPGEQAIAAESVLATLWRNRTAREPVLVVIDEAHNVCPAEPPDAVTRLSTELTARIAAEGRKFGIYLLVSTQRPQRVHELIVSQCDNVVLMRINAAADLRFIGETLSFAPPGLLARSTGFGLGESLVAGKIASHAALVKFGPRLAREGGSDVPTTWAGSS